MDVFVSGTIDKKRIWKKWGGLQSPHWIRLWWNLTQAMCFVKKFNRYLFIWFACRN